jgi:hypothetical protein
MRDKAALVTGASRGIGAATARLAAARGYRVAVDYLRNADAAAAVVAEIARQGGEAIAVQADVSVETDVQRLFHEIDHRFGRLDALVNNAGIVHRSMRVEEMTASRVTRMHACGQCDRSPHLRTRSDCPHVDRARRGGRGPATDIWRIRPSREVLVPYWILSPHDKKATLFAERAGNPDFSPDGRWLAYQSQEDSLPGQRQIFVQPFPATGARYPVVVGGHPFWSHDGSELYYNPAQQQIAVIRVTTEPPFSLGEPLVFSAGGLQSKNPANNPRVWDIAPDRKRLIGVAEATETTTSGDVTQKIEVVLNWSTELRARVAN